MNQNYYKLYIDSVLDLAQTIVIKSDEAALSINDNVTLYYGPNAVNVDNKATWKYYLNVCGDYHDTDTDMYITSLDTLEEIRFTKENLNIHKATSEAYQYGLRHYNELVSIYPNQEQLILGILYPAKMSHVINSPDGTILSYPGHLIESNEYSLIEKLQRWIDVFKIRWHNIQFGISDSLYSVCHLGLMYLNLVPAILNIRLSHCKTNEVHSYHVRTYLASHGMLDVYLDMMTKKQALFFYRNIAYIERNSGRREVFEWLIQKVMSDRRLPVGEFTMKHNESNMLSNIRAGISFRKKPINETYNAQIRSTFTLSETLDKEHTLAVGNPEHRVEHEKGIKKQFEYSLSSVVATKMLESSIIDYTDATVYTYQDIVLNHWLYLSSKNLFNVYISFKNPRTGDKIMVTAQDAFMYMFYIYAKAEGNELISLPTLIAKRVQRIPTPSVTDLMSVVDNHYVSSSVAVEALSYQPKITKSFSVKAFYDLTRSIFSAAQRQLGLISNQEHMYRRGLVYNMVCRIYCDVKINHPDTGDLFADWLVTKELPTDNFNMQECLSIYQEIFESGTGSALNTTDSVRNLQKAMLAIMTQLSSYSIQFVGDINDSNIKVVNWGAIRLGDIKSEQKAYDHFNDVPVTVVDTNAVVNRKLFIESNYPTTHLSENMKLSDRKRMDLVVKPFAIDKNNILETKKLFISSIAVKVTTHGQTGEYDHISTLPGYESFARLSLEEQLKIKDVYCHCRQVYSGPKINLDELILYTDLAGFEYMNININKLNGFKYENLNASTDALTNGVFIKELNAFTSFAGRVDFNGFVLKTGTTVVDGLTNSTSTDTYVGFNLTP